MTAFHAWDGRVVHLYCTGRERRHNPHEIAVVAPYQGVKPEDLEAHRRLTAIVLGDRAVEHKSAPFKDELDYVTRRSHGRVGQPRIETHWTEIRIVQGKNGPVWNLPACPTCTRKRGAYGKRIPEVQLKALIDAVAADPTRNAAMADVSYWPK